MFDSVQQVAACGGVCHFGDVCYRAFCYQSPTTLACARANVDDVVGAANGVLVVLYHYQCVAFIAERFERFEQHLVVARVQANGGLV